MQNTVLILSVLTFIFATLTIVAYLRGNTLLKCIFKPLTMLCVIAIAFLQPETDTNFYKWAVIIGLGLSLAGDVFLIFDKTMFLPGLIAFLLAHFCYVAAFYQIPAGWVAIYSAIPFVIYFGIFMGILWYSLGAMKIPVIVYALTITMMGRFAMYRWLSGAGAGAGSDDSGALLAFIGALVFIASDSFLAYDRFKKPIPYKDIYILSTYFLAQWLIALSI